MESFFEYMIENSQTSLAENDPNIESAHAEFWRGRLVQFERLVAVDKWELGRAVRYIATEGERYRKKLDNYEITQKSARQIMHIAGRMSAIHKAQRYMDGGKQDPSRN